MVTRFPGKLPGIEEEVIKQAPQQAENIPDMLSSGDWVSTERQNAIGSSLEDPCYVPQFRSIYKPSPSTGVDRRNSVSSETQASYGLDTFVSIILIAWYVALQRHFVFMIA